MARIFTEEQLAAIRTRDKTLLVSAAAGSGKTATLTERIIVSLLDEEAPLSVSDLLVVTYTRAAAKELRERITAALRQAAAEHPENGRLARELLAVRDAHITTIDGFCNELLHAGAEAVGLSPHYRIADTAEATLLANSVMEEMLEAAYAGELDGIPATAFAELTDCLTGARDEGSLSERLLQLYRHTLTAVEGVEVLALLIEQLNPATYTAAEQTVPGAYIMEESGRLLDHALTQLSRLRRELQTEASDSAERVLEDIVTPYLQALQHAREATRYSERRELLLSFINGKKKNWPRCKGEPSAVLYETRAVRDALMSELKSLMKESHLFDYTEAEWHLLLHTLYPKLQLLLTLLRHFSHAFREEKRRRALCEYSDLERYAYELLYTPDGERTDLARSQAERYRAIYIDEYQDVNELQNRIFEAVSREDNRFMVGDIKQSIYTFRSADPRIFARMKATLPPLSSGADAPAASLFMSRNFRSDPVVIDFVNEVFDVIFGLMGESIGYQPQDRLTAGKLYPEGTSPCRTLPEIHVLTTDKKDGESEAPDEQAEQAVCSAREREGAAIVARIRRMLQEESKDDGTPIRPEDIAILTRNNGAAKELAAMLTAAGISSSVRGQKDFFLNPEVLLVLCLLNAINNPRRDIYLAGLLRSPLYGITVDELVAVRRGRAEIPLYDALVEYVAKTPAFTCGARFLTELARYRELSEGMRTDDLIARLYRETGLLSLAAEGGGRDNLMLLQSYARRYEDGSHRGLYAFIAYLNRIIEEKETFEIGVESAEPGCVTLLTEHSSKGLEFPVVILAGTTRRMSSQQEAPSLVYTEGFGLALRERDPSGLATVTNPIFCAVQRYQHAREYEEEMRILYVALTRARERLLVFGCYSKPEEEEKQQAELRAAMLSPYVVRHFSSVMDLLLTVHPTATYHFYGDNVTPGVAEAPCPRGVGAANGETASDIPTTDGDEACNEALYRTLQAHFTYTYPHRELTTLPEKLAVSRLTPSLLDEGEQQTPLLLSLDEGGKEPPLTFLKKNGKPRLPAFVSGERADESAQRGIATHMFLQFCDLERLVTEGAERELARLREAALLSQEQADRVRLDEIEKFARSPLCAAMRSARTLYRELRFHVKLPATAFTTEDDRRRALQGHTILVQGVIDCLVEGRDGTLLLADYKTDRLTREQLADPAMAAARLRDTHTPQLSYYRLAVREMLGRLPDRTEVYSLHLGASVSIEAPDTPAQHDEPPKPL